MNTIVRVDLSGLLVWQNTNEAAVRRTIQMSGSSGSRAAKAEGSRLIRARKAIKVAKVNETLTIVTPTQKQRTIWAIVAKSELMPVAAFSFRPTKKGISVVINTGSRVVIAHAFKATMRSGHEGVFMRVGQATRAPIQGYKGHKRYAGRKRQPIKELFTTQVADAFEDALPAAGAKGREVFESTFRRVLPLEIAKRSTSS
mgnify:CR=1 FL=1